LFAAFVAVTARRLSATVARPFALRDWTIVAGVLAMLAAAWLRRHTIMRRIADGSEAPNTSRGRLALPPPT
jgi:hypothetical protein